MTRQAIDLTMRSQQVASCFPFIAASFLPAFEAPIKQNRLIKYEGISEVGGCTYSNRLSFLNVYMPEKRAVRR